MKSMKPRGGLTRERGYWQPARPVMQMTARIEEIEIDAPPPAPPSSRRGEVALLVRGRRIRTAAAMAAVSITLAATFVGPFAPSHSRAASTPAASSTSAGDTAQASTSPDPTPAWTDPPVLITPMPYVDPGDDAVYVDPTPDAFPTLVANGWPVTLPGFEGDAQIGPDGTVYVDRLDPIGMSGHARPDWLPLPDGTRRQPALFGPNGTTYVLADDESGTGELWAFDTKGNVVAGWPVETTSDATVLPGPSGTIYVLTQGEVTVLASTGAVRAKWAVSMPGMLCSQVVRPDGTLFLATGPDGVATDCSIHVYASTGRELTSDPQRGWNGLAMSSDGTVVAWGYDFQPYSETTVARTRVAIVGPDGQPASGWPVVFEGTVSSPAFASDGTIYLTQLGLGTAPSKIVALDRNGALRPGWPVSLPAGYGPLQGPTPPAIAANGAVYIAAIDSLRRGYVIALDPTGTAVPGWPYEVPQAFGSFESFSMWSDPENNPSPVLAATATGSTVVYLVLEDRIVALDRSGKVMPGWPFTIPASDGPATWGFVAADGTGGLVAIEWAERTDDPGWLIRRWTPAGQPPK
jgi:outer membrane protein assembly factor BamB